MPALNVQSSIEIAAGIDDVRSTLCDFNTWPAWSPWLYTEPEATVTYTGEPGQAGHSYEWRGNKVGAGGMRLLTSDDRVVTCDLNFLKPFKSQADVSFELEPKAPSLTGVTWKMDSKLPFFLFFFKDTMSGMIRSDYHRGLLMLKDYIEKGEILSSPSTMDTVEREAAFYIGNPGEAAMGELSTVFEERFSALFAAASEASIEITGAPMCFYKRMDIKQGRCGFIVALPTAQRHAISAPMVSQQRPACKALRIVHTGAYRHLGNAWATLMGEARAKKLKPNKRQPPFEIYLNDPDTTDETELITEIYLPLR